MPVIDEMTAKQVNAALVAGVAEIERLSKQIEQMQARIAEFEQTNAEIATYVEAVVCSRSRSFTGQPPFLGWRGVGFALAQDYDELDRLRAQAAELPEEPPSEERPQEDSSVAATVAASEVEPLNDPTEPEPLNDPPEPEPLNDPPEPEPLNYKKLVFTRDDKAL